MRDIYILGLSAFYHDSAACLIKNGIILSAAQEERFTRKKHDDTFPMNSIKYCLDNSEISINDVEYITFYEKPFIKFERILETYLSYAPIGIKSFLKSIPLWIKKKLWIKEIIRKELDYSGKILFTEHHESHAASAFFPSPFQEAAFITFDGVGEWSTSSFGVGENNQIQLLADIKFPHSIGLLYSAFTYYLGFKVNSGEYKLMGLAPYGEPKYKKLIYEKLIDVKKDGSFKMNMDYFNYCAGLQMTNSKFNHLFGGKPRIPESQINQHHMDMARSIQEVTEEIVLRIAMHVKNETGKKNLCLAGGVALNCVANGKIVKEKIFENIWIQPAAGDAGGAIGTALLTWYQYLNNKRVLNSDNDAMQGSYLGPKYDDNDIQSILDKNRHHYKKLNENELPAVIADLIADEKVIGWFQGRMEFGPRALGSRSIIGDARSAGMQSKINLKIKFRESFRPFAPAVLEEKSNKYFDLEFNSPYMLLVGNIKKEKLKNLSKDEKELSGLDKLKVSRSEVPAITHVDNSARIQTVCEKTNPKFFNMISAFNKKYNCPIIINTSFNVRGEPIVCTPQEALNCFINTDMDFLLMDDFLLDKNRLYI